MSSLEPKKLIFNLQNLSANESVTDAYEEEQRQIKENERYENYKNSGVPEKFFETTLETYVAETSEEVKNKDAVIKFSNAPKNRILIFCGRNGNGKTHLGCGVIRKCGGVFILSSDLCIEYEAGTSYHSKRTREEILKAYSKTQMLVIDECGKYTMNENLEKFLLAYVVSARYENNLPTVLITNANKKGFIEFLGKSVFDRLTEVCTTLEFNGESKRKSRRVE